LYVPSVVVGRKKEDIVAATQVSDWIETRFRKQGAGCGPMAGVLAREAFHHLGRTVSDSSFGLACSGSLRRIKGKM
jgi:hypothetical protein